MFDGETDPGPGTEPVVARESGTEPVEARGGGTDPVEARGGSTEPVVARGGGTEPGVGGTDPGVVARRHPALALLIEQGLVVMRL